MTWQQIIDFTLAKLWGISSSQYPDVATDLNIAYHYVKRAITNIREDFFWDMIDSQATVIWQSEYRIPVISTWDANFQTKIQKVMGASMKYSTTGSYTKLERLDQYQLDKDLSYYTNGASQSNPFCFIADDSLFVYPAPVAVVTSWLRIYGIKGLIDINASTVEVNIFGGKISPEFHYVIWMYMRYLYFLERWVDFKNDAREAMANFNQALNEMLLYLKLRNDWIIFKKQPV